MRYRYARPYPSSASRGFTLVECIIVLVVLGIAAVGIISLQSSIFGSQAQNKNIQIGVQLMQECAEQILAARRNGTGGYGNSSLASSATATALCSGMTLTGYNAPTVTITAGNSTTAGLAACPTSTGSNCTLATITQGGLTSVTLMLVSY